jgi:hypothetical protein
MHKNTRTETQVSATHLDVFSAPVLRLHRRSRRWRLPSRRSRRRRRGIVWRVRIAASKEASLRAPVASTTRGLRRVRRVDVCRRRSHTSRRSPVARVPGAVSVCCGSGRCLGCVLVRGRADVGSGGRRCVGRVIVLLLRARSAYDVSMCV